MTRRACLALLLAIMSPVLLLAQTQTTFTGNISSIGTPGSDLLQVRVSLVNCGNDNPTIPGVTIPVVNQITLTANSSGLVSTSIWANTLILCSGYASTVYQVTYLRNNVVTGVPRYYRIVDTVPFNLNTATPVTTLPPTHSLLNGYTCPSPFVMIGFSAGFTAICSLVTNSTTMGVALTPTTTQSVVQPAGTYLAINNMENIRFVDPSAGGYTTIAQAIASLPTTGNQGGIIYVQPGTYAGPTSIPSGTRIVSLGSSYPPNIFTQFNGPAFNASAPGPASAALATLQYTSSLTIQDVNRIALLGVVLDFQGLGGLVLKGVAGSEFDLSVMNAATTAPAVILDADNTNHFNSINNHFANLYVNGGSSGVQFGNAVSGGQYFTNNNFDYIGVMVNTQPTGTYTAFNVIGNCDSNRVHRAALSTTTAVTNFNGWVLGSSLTADTDADGFTVDWYDETWAATRTGGHAITVNYSTNNAITTGALDAGADGKYAYYPDAGAPPYNSPWFQWNQLGPNFPAPFGSFAQFPGLAVDSGSQGTPGVSFNYGGVNSARIYEGTGNNNILYFYGKAANSGAGGNVATLNLQSGGFTAGGYLADAGASPTGYSYSRSGALKYQSQLGADGNFYFYGGSAGTTQYFQFNTAGNANFSYQVQAASMLVAGCGANTLVKADGTGCTSPPASGVAVLVGGFATVSNTAACTPSGSSCVYKFTNCGRNSSTGIGTLALSAVTPGTSFQIESLSAGAAATTTDVSNVCWQIN